MNRVARGIIAASALFVIGCADPGPEPVVSLTLSASSILLESGTTSQLNASDQGRGGRALEGRQLTWRSSDESVATVDASGRVRAGYITGGTEDTATITVTAGERSATARVRVLPSREASVELGTAFDLSFGEGHQLSPVVRDARSNLLTNRTITYLSRDASIVRVSANGLITADGASGVTDRVTHVVAFAGGVRDSVRVRVLASAVGSLKVASPFVYLAPGGTRRLRLSAYGPAGEPLVGLVPTWSSSNPALVTVSPSGVVTAANGGQQGASTISATLGGQTVTTLVTVNPCGAAPPGDFPVELRLLGEPPSPAMVRALHCSFERMRGYLRGGPGPVAFVNFDASICGASAPLTEFVHGVIIYAWFGVIDGLGGGTAANAGPCFTGPGIGLTVLGRMSFDVPDMPAFESYGLLEALVTHEMLHALGIGTLWFSRGMVQGVGPFERFTGPLARTACIQDLGGVTQCQDGAPIGDCFVSTGCGWGGSHWRESVFGREVVTSWLNFGENPLSSLTLQALADLGYTVDHTLADDLTLPTPVSAMLQSAGVSAWRMSEPTMPVGRVDRFGRIVPK